MIGPQEEGCGVDFHSEDDLTEAEKKAAKRFQDLLSASNGSQQESLQLKFGEETATMALVVASRISVMLTSLCPNIETKDAVIHILDLISKDSQRCREIDPEGFEAFVKKGALL